MKRFPAIQKQDESAAVLHLQPQGANNAQQEGKAKTENPDEIPHASSFQANQ
jgi:hypothetical protein